MGKAYDNSVENCYNIGEVVSNKALEVYVGGIAGYAGPETVFTNCYYLDSCNKGVGNGTDSTTGYVAEQMRKQSAFAGFDFEKVWTMAGNEEYLYPELVDVDMVFVKDEPNHITIGTTSNIVNDHIVLFVKSDKEITTQVLHIALYSEAGQMLDYIIVPTVEPFTTANVIFDDDADVKTAKVFLWDSLSTTTPIAEAVEVTIR